MSISDHDSSVIVMPVKNAADALSFKKLALVPENAEDFDFIKFFSGPTRASGWFSDRFGKPRRHFCGDFYGDLSGSELKLYEELRFSDGLAEQRVWAVTDSRDGNFTAESDSLIGSAVGRFAGSTLSLQYRMKVLVDKDKYWELDMRDLMILQPDGSLHNITHVYKCGIRIGTVSAIYLRHSGGA